MSIVAPPAPTRAWIRRGQSGASLLEVLVGIAVMVPLTLASVSGLLLGMKVSDSTRTDQRMEVELTAATEDLAAAPYLVCGTAHEYQQVLEAWRGKLDVDLVPGEESRRPDAGVTGVEYWDAARSEFRRGCSGDDGAQRLTVTVFRRGGDGIDSTVGTVVKRNSAARGRGAR